MQGGDFMVATNILLSGNNFSKIALFFRYMNIGVVSPKSFRLMQSHYFIDSIKDFWEKKRASIIDRLRQKDSIAALGKYGTALYITAAYNWTYLLTVHEKLLFPSFCKVLINSTYVYVTLV